MHIVFKQLFISGAIGMAFISGASAAPLNVVTSFSIIDDFARQVGGDRVTVKSIVPANGDAHAYEPKPADVIALKRADLVLVNGLQFDTFMQRLAKSSETKAPVVEVTKGIEPLKNAEDEHGHGGEPAHDDHDHDHGHEHDHGEYDPHAWQSVPNAMIYVKNIADALCKVDSAGCESYKANASAYTQKLQALHESVKAAFSALPKDKRTLITSHDAFGYLGAAYGLTLLAPEGTSSATEATAADVAAIIRQIREDKGSAVFMENISNPALIKQIAAEGNVAVGGKLYSDALSGPDAPASTYLKMMQYNADTITKAILKK
ncbi:MAG TPA: ABC transporter substrate-binding protein [Advenella kashmirensis]|uniref:ABC transporter substrate-binding protein n=1 Tax=Advenella kashmirensis TaxID=310575 RepID=A0A356LBB1_9BURK|nr:ABC transporter substrate-binding protein [Advenella kashmirensis]